jgi:hypothetical protein
MVDCRVVGASLQQQNIEIYVVCETEQLIACADEKFENFQLAKWDAPIG